MKTGVHKLSERCVYAGVTVALLIATSLASAAQRLGIDDARHLLVRTSFAAAPAEVEAFARLTRNEAVERLLASARLEPSTRPEASLDSWTPRSQIRAMSEEQRREHIRHTNQQGQQLRGWWLNEMLVTASPFTERMTLIWHNHFVSSLQKVRPTRLMHRQNLLLRQHALGSFEDMLYAVARDPAMVVYLDGASNRKGTPNENFARELMELFTLGEGNYTEQDVREAARAFTGFGIDGETGEFVFRRALHDDGNKTVLGRTGTLGGEAVIDILLAHPRTAQFVVTKLWREFVSPHPDENEVRRIADEFRRSRYDIAVAMRALLTSEAFYAPANRAALVKSPIDLVVGTLRTFRFEVGDPFPLVQITRSLGQDLMAPPNVKGWPGGEAWINASTLLGRKQFIERLFRGAEPSPVRGDEMRVQQASATPQALARARFQRGMAELRFDERAWFTQLTGAARADVARFILPAPPVVPIAAADDRLALIRQLTLDPAYQLK
jgi:uncharacterized protein (DUF1800 family)